MWNLKCLNVTLTIPIRPHGFPWDPVYSLLHAPAFTPSYSTLLADQCIWNKMWVFPLTHPEIRPGLPFMILCPSCESEWTLETSRQDVVLHPWGSESLQWRGSGLCLEKLLGDLMGHPSQSDSDFKGLSSLALMCSWILQIMALLTPFPYLEMFPHDLPPSQ